MITLRQLHYYIHLAETRHFGRAADKAAVSQPALSVQIKDLEAHLGLDLVERHSGGARLTADGEQVLERAKQVISLVTDMEEFGSARQKTLSGRFKLGIIPSIAPYLLPDILPLLRFQYENLDLVLRETRTENLLEELAQGQLDAAIVALPVEPEGLESKHLFEDPFYFAVPRGSYDSTSVSVDDIDMQRLLLLEEGHCLRDQALQACALASNPLMESVGASSLTTLIQLISNGYGTTLLPRICVEKESLTDHIDLIPFVDPCPSRQIGLVWRKSATRHKDYQALADVITTTFAQKD